MSSSTNQTSRSDELKRLRKKLLEQIVRAESIRRDTRKQPTK